MRVRILKWAERVAARRLGVSHDRYLRAVIEAEKEMGVRPDYWVRLAVAVQRWF
jgi:hypothetical protein